MEGVLAWKNIKFMIEDWLEADVAHLRWIDRDMLVFLLPLLFSKELCRIGMYFQLLLQKLNLFMVLLKAFTKVVLHILHLFIWREQRQKVVDFQSVP